jgi:hypothetical protein
LAFCSCFWFWFLPKKLEGHRSLDFAKTSLNLLVPSCMNATVY